MRLLCVEDEAPLREDIVEYLRMKAYEVDEAENGEAAIEQLNHHHYDLVLCDIKMPRMSGYDLLRHVRSENGYAKMPFLFLSALSDRDDKVKASQTGCDGYLTKPIDFSVLDASIRAQVDRQRARDFVNISMLESTRKHVMAALDDAMNGPIAGAMMVAQQFVDGALTQEEQKLQATKLQRYLSSHLQSMQQFHVALQFQTRPPGLQIVSESLAAIIQRALIEARGINPSLAVRDSALGAAGKLQVRGDVQMLHHAFASLIAQIPYDYPSNRIIGARQEEDRVVVSLCDTPDMLDDEGYMLIDGATDLVALSPVTRKRLIPLSFAMQVAQTHRGWLEVKIGAEEDFAIRFQLPQ